MARRDIFRNIKGPEGERADEGRPMTPKYAVQGASRNMLSSIQELAERAAHAQQVPEGEAIVELDTRLLDKSFVSDRMDEEAGFLELVDAIRAQGQDSPILVRPNASSPGRYQIVFGHRRVRAAEALGIKVKAIVRSLSDVDHVIAQGQENSARENLSFIERALFAQRLINQNYDRSTVQSALSLDAPMLTRLLSVTGRVPEELLLAVGPAPTIGRDRWIEFAQAVEHPAARAAAFKFADSEEFGALTSDARFERLLLNAKQLARKRVTAQKPVKGSWQIENKQIAADFVDSGRSFSLSFRSKEGPDFGRFLAQNLTRLYAEFKATSNEGKG